MGGVMFKKVKSKSKIKPIIMKVTALTASLSFFGFASAVYIVDGADATATVAMQPAMLATNTSITTNFQSVVAVFESSMNAMDVAVSNAFKLENQMVMDAVKVLTKQSSVSANILAENTVQNAQAEASVLEADKKKERILQTNETYGVNGQGYKVCTVLSERQQIENAAVNNKNSVPSQTTNTVYASAGGYGDPHKVKQAMNENHSMKYCTSEQAASGYCDRVTGESGWDLLASTLFTPTVEGSPVYDAQNALINNMVGLPDRPMPKTAQGSPNASKYLASKQNKDAIISPAIYSLKSIQAEFTGLGSPDSGAKIIPIVSINDQVRRYLGSGEEYMNWNKVLVGASEHGVMKELLQIQALQLYLKARQYHQGEREEMLLAGLVAATQKSLAVKNGESSYGGNISESEKQKLKVEAREIKVATAKSLMNLN